MGPFVLFCLISTSNTHLRSRLEHLVCVWNWSRSCSSGFSFLGLAFWKRRVGGFLFEKPSSFQSCIRYFIFGVTSPEFIYKECLIIGLDSSYKSSLDPFDLLPPSLFGPFINIPNQTLNIFFFMFRRWATANHFVIFSNFLIHVQSFSCFCGWKLKIFQYLRPLSFEAGLKALNYITHYVYDKFTWWT